MLGGKADFTWITNDFLFFGWLKLAPKSLKTEIRATKHRLQIDDDEFKFTFVENLPSHLAEKFMKEDYYDEKEYSEKDMKNQLMLHKKLIFKKRRATGGMNIDEEFSIIHDKSLQTGNTFRKNKINVLKRLETLDLEKPQQMMNKRFSRQSTKRSNANRIYKGDTILREIGLLETALMGVRWPILVFLLLRMLIPLITVFSYGGFSFSLGWYEYFMLFLVMVLCLLIYGVNLTFIYAGIIDFKRKLFYMRILKAMISPEKDKFFAFSTYFPTINICSTQNLNSWMVLREASLDLGKKYTYRIFVYCSVFMAFYFTFFIFLVLSFIGILPYQLPVSVYVIGSYDITVILGIILYMIYIGALINEFFDEHKTVFIKLKKLFWSARNDWDGMIRKSARKGTTLKVFVEMLSLVNIPIDQRDDYCDQCLNLVDIIIEKLDHTKEIEPLKLMGLTASRSLLTSIYTGLASIAFAASQILYLGV